MILGVLTDIASVVVPVALVLWLGTMALLRWRPFLERYLRDLNRLSPEEPGYYVPAGSDQGEPRQPDYQQTPEGGYRRNGDPGPRRIRDEDIQKGVWS